MKNIRKFLVLLILLVPFTVNADNTIDNVVSESNDHFTTVVDDDVKAEKDVNGSTVVAGNNVISTNTVDGINMLFGNNVQYQGNSDYAVIAGNIVNLSGNINNDGFIFGNIVTIDSNFNADRDLFVFANSVTIQGSINRDITIYAADVKLDNAQVMGNITVYASSLEISEKVNVNGTLSYNEDIEKNISESALITETKLLEKIVEELSIPEKISTFLIDYAGMMVIFLVLAFTIPSLFKKIEASNEEFNVSKFFSLFGFGALFLIGVPMAIIVLFTTVIGTPLALIALFLYIIFICITTILSGYLLGYIIWKNFIKKENNVLLIGLIGISIVYVLNMIPVIGGYIAMISLMIGLGIVLKLFKK